MLQHNGNHDNDCIGTESTSTVILGETGEDLRNLHH